MQVNKGPLQPGERRLAFEFMVVLDGTGTGQATDWTPPSEDYLDFGPCNQAFFSWQMWVTGPGASNVTMNLERNTLSDQPEMFVAMNTSPIALARSGWSWRDFGRAADSSSDLLPQGLCRPRLTNAAAGDNFAAVRMRIWVSGQAFTSAKGAAA